MKGQTETHPSPSKCMLVSLHSGSTIPMEQSLLQITNVEEEHFNKSNHQIKVQEMWGCREIKSPVFVCEVHSHDDVFLCILMTAGVDDDHVAHPFWPPAL